MRTRSLPLIIVLAAGSAAHATTLFSDNFTAATPGYTAATGSYTRDGTATNYVGSDVTHWLSATSVVTALGTPAGSYSAFGAAGVSAGNFPNQSVANDSRFTTPDGDGRSVLVGADGVYISASRPDPDEPPVATIVTVSTSSTMVSQPIAFAGQATQLSFTALATGAATNSAGALLQLTFSIGASPTSTTGDVVVTPVLVGMTSVVTSSTQTDVWNNYTATLPTVGTTGYLKIAYYSPDSGASNGTVRLDDIAVNTVPEPAAFGLAAFGVGTLLRRRRCEI